MSVLSQTGALLVVGAPLALYILSQIYQYAQSRKTSSSPLNRCIFDLGIASILIFFGLLAVPALGGQPIALSNAIVVFILYMIFLTVIGVLIHFQFTLSNRSAALIIVGQTLCCATLALYFLEFDVYLNFGNGVMLVGGIVFTAAGVAYQWL